jgi:hypothetical protein
MDVRIAEGHDIRAIADGAVGPGVWVGAGAAALGLNGEVNLKDWKALSDLVTDEVGDQGNMNPYQEKTTEGTSLLEQMRRDGLL